MTDKDIISQKGNIKCIFYNDNICRKGDRTRDCLNCARVEYKSLYRLNWKSQEQLELKTQECEQLQEKYEALKLENQEGYEIVAELKHECEQKEKELKELKRQYKLSCLDCEYKNTKADVDRYRKALEEIEDFRKKHCDFWCEGNRILDIINKAKGD